MSKPVSMAEQTALSIVNMIRENGYSDGDKLPPERDLAVLLGVSRTTLREALKRLSAWGYIRSVQGGGNYVNFVNCESDDHTENMRMIRECICDRISIMENELQAGGRIASAIEAGDAQTAVREIKEHIENIKKYLM